MAEHFFDPSERARVKQASRDRDDRDLAEGRIDAAALQRRNAFIPRQAARDAVIAEWKEFD